ncbi:MAG: PIN domain-containing protein [Nanoarchaeota archaeon]|nr:PIN domain-containing protein [Nanoarchaeota archaeon]
MLPKTYYVDSCIWLNFFKKEGDINNGVPYWKLAENFFEKIIFSEDNIIYSGFILKEIKYNLNNNELFKEKQAFIQEEPKFKFVKVVEEDYAFGRKLEYEFNFEISFFDCMHIAISKRLRCILVTRDRLLIKKAKKFVSVNKPEELFS